MLRQWLYFESLILYNIVQYDKELQIVMTVVLKLTANKEHAKVNFDFLI